NAYGQVVGITSAKINSQYGEGLGFAIPIDEATPIIDDLIKYGYVTGRPTLGISGENVTDVYSQYYDIPKGFFVRSVESGSAAEQAGIQVNDIVIGIEGNLIESIEEFNEIKENYKAGDKITVSVYRDGEIIDKEVTLGEAIDKEDDEDQQSQYPQYDDYDDYDSYRQFFNQFGYR
ncbi:MAG: S1C family serine protease, partial [Oscillospiraceae bacterium]